MARPKTQWVAAENTQFLIFLSIGCEKGGMEDGLFHYFYYLFYETTVCTYMYVCVQYLYVIMFPTFSHTIISQPLSGHSEFFIVLVHNTIGTFSPCPLSVVALLARLSNHASPDEKYRPIETNNETKSVTQLQ